VGALIMERAAILITLLLLALTLGVWAAPPCGVPPGESCSTDLECSCLHGED
jgi:hypothetical protein